MECIDKQVRWQSSRTALFIEQDRQDLVDDYQEWLKLKSISEDLATPFWVAYRAFNDMRDNFGRYESVEGDFFQLDFSAVADEAQLCRQPHLALRWPDGSAVRVVFSKRAERKWKRIRLQWILSHTTNAN